MRALVPAVVIVSLAAASHGAALADVLELNAADARAIARAGAVLVSGDGTSALLLSPGGMVRRTNPRLQLGVGVHDDDSTYRARGDGGPDPDDAEVLDRGAPIAAPHVAFLFGGGRVVAGVAFTETADVNRALPEPEFGRPASEIVRLFPHRYGGLALSYQRRQFAAGVAIRAQPWLGVGVTAIVAQASLREDRHVWAGFNGIDDVGDPSRDLRLRVSGDDSLIPGAVIGVFIAPPDLPVEAALAAQGSLAARLSGEVDLASTQPAAFPTPIVGAGSAARMTLTSPLVVRGGARYLGRRVVVEANGEIAVISAADPRWTVADVAVVDDSSRADAITEVPSLVARQHHGAGRLAVDVEIIEGFLYGAAGYGFQTAATPRARLSPVLVGSANHTIGLGAEAQWNNVTLTIGYARTLSPTVDVTDSEITIINPFDGGTGPAVQGSLSRGHDAFGVAVEAAWD